MSKLIPFDLERALASEEVITRDGRKILKVACVEETAHPYPVAAFIQGNGMESWENFTKKGKFSVDEDREFDLFMKPKNKKLYIAIQNVKENDGKGNYYMTTAAYETEENLIDNIDVRVLNSFTIHEIEVEE